MARVHTGPAVGLAAQLAVLAAVHATVALTAAGWLAGTAYGVGLAVLLNRSLTRAGRTTLTPADRVTLARSTLAGAVTALVTEGFLEPVAVGPLVALTVVAVVLDGVDGRVARHTGTVSALGARFDMEVDAFLILVLSVHVAVAFGPWVLLIGAARYLFVAAGQPWSWLRRPLRPRYWCKVVAVVQAVVLTLASASVLPAVVTRLLILAALALLVESFGRDVIWLWRHRTAQAISPQSGLLRPTGNETTRTEAGVGSSQVGAQQSLGGVGRADLDRADLRHGQV